MAIINEEKIEKIIAGTKFDEKKFLWIIKKAKKAKGLSLEETSILFSANNPAHRNLLFETAFEIKQKIYGNRIVLFAPLYISNYCKNRCAYCGFQNQNHLIIRKKLSQEKVKEQVKILLDMGHKRVLLEFGEDEEENPIKYILETIKTIYAARNKKNDYIRRINLNIAATSVENYRKLAGSGIGTYNLFQETYHRQTYKKMHPAGTPKHNYERQLFSHSRAIEAGLNDLGFGALFGLYNWKFETLALLSHAQYLDKTFGIGPHTISVPRIRPATDANFKVPYPVSDENFLKIIAILRMAVPYAGIVLSTREPIEIRNKALNLGVSQISAASSTEVGGYSNQQLTTDNLQRDGQFEIYDARTLDEVVANLLEKGFIPSWCTGCEYKGRQGCSFMKIAKAGLIKNFCAPNAIITLKEYLLFYASEKTRVNGDKLIEKELKLLPEKQQIKVSGWLKRLDRKEKEYFYL